MMTRRILMGSAGALLAQHLMAQNATGGRKVVFEHDVPDLTLKGWSATAVEVTYAPGESSAAHRHPGITIAYVLEGEIRSKVGDEPEKTYTAGQMFLETPNQLHAVSRNASTTRPAKLLAVLLAEKGKQLTTPA
jgi:quercetin dioxygenase-like cupin family protein